MPIILKTPLLNMNSLQLKTLSFHSGFHGNYVTIIARYVADVYCPEKPLYQI